MPEIHLKLLGNETTVALTRSKELNKIPYETGHSVIVGEELCAMLLRY